ncbi:MAG: nickel-type superoxide dismutase maturation protease [Streptosporangiaceae bacterium]
MHWPIWRVMVTERSMEPALRPGDWLLVRRTRRIRAGQIVLARHPERPELLLVKRAAGRVDDGWWLASDNPAAGAVDSARFGAVPVPFIEGRVLGRYWRPRSLVRTARDVTPRHRERNGPAKRRGRSPYRVNSVVDTGVGGAPARQPARSPAPASPRAGAW